MTAISATRAFALIRDVVAGLPDAWRQRLVAELKLFEPRLEARTKAGVPVRKGPRPSLYARGRQGTYRPAGGLVSLLSTRLDEDNLRLSAGLLTPDARKRGFYGYILDAGRGLRSARSRPRTRQLFGATVDRSKAGRYTKPYTRKISPISPGRYDITFGRVRTWAREEIGPVLLRVYDQALSALLRGVP